MTLSDEARNFNWLLNSFVDQTAGVTDAVAVSSDGLLMAASSSLDRASASNWRRSSRVRQPGPRGVALLRLRRPRTDHRGDAPGVPVRLVDLQQLPGRGRHPQLRHRTGGLLDDAPRRAARSGPLPALVAELKAGVVA